ncbi:organic solute transport protein 1-domain-containing protein [Ochromonadaceae sp. CCMP2298]|nr:organic solute transport protein 1-domain-containing protein [Ochromonadaceae sp. CCMP2298]
MSMLGSLYAMPILVLNMGGEMIYILHQRLHAQSIAPEKARKVLADVVRTMYTPSFLEELFRPQDIYTVASTKQIFDKLAHSSIMRLNKTSMDKLFDLMSMGVKYQLLSCRSPHQYLQLTMNHLESILDMVMSEGVSELIQAAMSSCMRLYSSLNQGNWLLLEQVLLQFFQDKRIKVSLFLQRNMQSMTGTLMLTNTGNLPPGTHTPGTIRHFEQGRVIRAEQFPTPLSECKESGEELMEEGWPIGLNMYTKDHNPPKKLSLPEAKAEAKAAAPSKYSAEMSAKAGLCMLADMLGQPTNSAKKGETDKMFKINLFPNQGFQSKEGEGEKGAEGLISIDIDASGAKSLNTYIEELDWDEQEPAGAKGGDEDEDDLLAMMDSAK